MPRLRSIRWLLALPVLLATLMPAWLAAQDDPNDMPLGDLARTLRKKTPPQKDVIDDDNFSKVMEQAEIHHATGSGLKFLMTGAGNGFHVSAPDVTCSLAFTANVKALLSNQYAQMELPTADVARLEGPATIEGDTLIVAIYNRTEWHVSEVAVALTVVKKNDSRDASLSSDTAYMDAVGGSLPPEAEVRPEKKPDVTVIYRMRAAALPFATTVFSAPLNLEVAPDEEWHWAIVQARGYPPQSYAGHPTPPAPTDPPASAQINSVQPPQPILSPASADPKNPPTLSPSQGPR
jgi:hypothetical protein